MLFSAWSCWSFIRNFAFSSFSAMSRSKDSWHWSIILTTFS